MSPITAAARTPSIDPDPRRRVARRARAGRRARRLGTTTLPRRRLLERREDGRPRSGRRRRDGRRDRERLRRGDICHAGGREAAREQEAGREESHDSDESSPRRHPSGCLPPTCHPTRVNLTHSTPRSNGLFAPSDAWPTVLREMDFAALAHPWRRAAARRLRRGRPVSARSPARGRRRRRRSARLHGDARPQARDRRDVRGPCAPSGSISARSARVPFP